MTIIVYRDGVMAADTGGESQGATTRWMRKLARDKQGTLYGVAGMAECAHRFLNWVDDGSEGVPPLPEAKGNDDNTFLIMRCIAGRLPEIVAARGTEFCLPSARYVVLGACREVALGALWMGATAEQAVQVCIEHSLYAHGDVVSVSHDG